MKALLLSGLIVLIVAGGACARSAPPDTGVIADGGTTASASEPFGDGEPREGSESDHGIPPAYLPPPGQCRIWLPEEPPERQARENPVGRCSTLRETIPAGGWLVYRPTDDSGVVRVWQYGEDGQVLHQRIYDVATGELLRHVGPMGN